MFSFKVVIWSGTESSGGFWIWSELKITNESFGKTTAKLITKGYPYHATFLFYMRDFDFQNCWSLLGQGAYLHRPRHLGHWRQPNRSRQSRGPAKRKRRRGLPKVKFDGVKNYKWKKNTSLSFLPAVAELLGPGLPGMGRGINESIVHAFVYFVLIFRISK